MELRDDDLEVFLSLPTELYGVFDPRGGLVWTNQPAREVLGYRFEELQQLPLDQLVHPEDASLGPRDVSDYPAAGNPATFESRYRRKDGAYRWFEWTGAFDAERGLLFGAARDVTDRHDAWDSARESERLVQAILDQTPAVIAVRDPEGRYVMVNQAFLEPLNMTADDVIGRTPGEIWGDATQVRAGDDARVLAGETVTTDLVVDVGEGPRSVITTRFPLLDETGQVAGQVAVANDITERVRFEQELAVRERLLDTIVTACPDIVTMLDERGRVREVSQASARILGYDLEHPVHEELEALIHPDDAPRVYEEYGALMRMERPTLDIRYRVRHRLGHWVTLHTLGRAIAGEHGRAAGAVVVSRDITGDLAFEEELQSAAAVAERASRAKSDFLSRMSHELRTPLNSVLGFAQLLAMDDLGPEQVEAVGHIIRAGEHLLELIDEVLDIARIELGQPDVVVDDVQLGDVIGDAVDLSGPLAADHGVEIRVDVQSCPPDAYVRADRQRLLQVLLNLLSNGIKYNHRGGRVEVSVLRAAGRTRVIVCDTGPGIDPADAERVFRPFDRLGAEGSGVEGTGVGLSVSKQLVEQMGGEILLDSAVGEGATFTVLLPSGTPPRVRVPVAPPSEVAPPSSGRVRVLHVEDNVANLELVEQLLARSEGVEVYAAMHGGLAIEMARDRRPDLVLLDLGLPDMHGTEVLAELKADPATASIPVVVVSADATPEQIRRLHSMDVMAYLTKPVDVRELLRIVESIATSSKP
ncbi:MAG: hybrid sensor histidine kinase/response regulator [Acidimicrobiales bacterium]